MQRHLFPRKGWTSCCCYCILLQLFTVARHFVVGSFGVVLGVDGDVVFGVVDGVGVVADVGVVVSVGVVAVLGLLLLLLTLLMLLVLFVVAVVVGDV